MPLAIALVVLVLTGTVIALIVWLFGRRQVDVGLRFSGRGSSVTREFPLPRGDFRVRYETGNHLLHLTLLDTRRGDTRTVLRGGSGGKGTSRTFTVRDGSLFRIEVQTVPEARWTLEVEVVV